MLSPVLDFSIQRFWTCSFEWLFLNVLVPCGGKRYVQGNMLSDLLVFSQGEAKIRSDTHFHTLAVIQQQPLRTLVWLHQSSCVLTQRIGSWGALEMCSWFLLLR